MKNGKLRLLVTSYDYRPRFGGIATLTYELARAMQKNDSHLEIRVMTPWIEGCEEFDRESGLHTTRVRLPSRPIFAIPSLTTAISREILTWSPHGILNMLWLPDGIASYLAAPARMGRGTRYFVYVHGVEILETSSSLRKKVRASLAPIKRSVIQNSTLVFTNSGFTRELVKRECGLPEERVQVAPPGVDVKSYFPAAPARDLVERFGLENRKVLLTVSRLEDYKGMDRGIAAMRRIVNDHPEALYLICGDGPDRGRLEGLIRHHRMQRHVILAGPVPDGRVRDFYNLAEAFVMLSRSNWDTPNVEGFGIVYLEAAACGKPSIAGASGGVPEAVGGEAFGWLVDPTDDQAIEGAMRAVLASPEETWRRGIAARERALREFSWERMAEQITTMVRKRVK